MAPPATYKQICASFQHTNNRVDFKGRYNVLNFTITLHHLNWLQIWSPGGATCNSCKLALISTLQSALLEFPHCLELPSWHYQLVLTWYLHQVSSSVKSQQRHSLTHSRTSGSNYRTPGLPGSDKNLKDNAL